MAQAGMHALVGTVVRKFVLHRDWAMLGIILGSMAPDLDNYLVAVATVTKQSTAGLHRTFTHSIFAILAVVVLFFLIGLVTKRQRWTTLGLGLGLGIGLHIALDLLLWFDGVELLWPFSRQATNFWANYTPDAWVKKLLEPAEFLFFALFFFWLFKAAQQHKTDVDFLGALRWWMIFMGLLWVVFAILAFATEVAIVTTIYGALYLLSLTAAFVIVIRMRKTVEA